MSEEKVTKNKEESKELEDKKDEAVVTEQSSAAKAKSAYKPKTTAKAGKRSEKGLKEAEEKQEKIEKQKAGGKTGEEDEKSSKPKAPIKPARPKIERRSKNYRESAKLIDKKKVYSLTDAIDLALQTSRVKFDASVELHIRLNVDPKQADQNIRDNLVLPAGTGKTVRVAVFSEEDVVKNAKKAGADVAGTDDFLKQLDKGEIDFDVLIATPNVMAKLSKYARILGPKGLMPNPKSGTVTNDVEKAISTSKAGKVEYRVDSTGIVHLAIGKVSFGKEKISKNAEAVFASIKQNKPSSIKGTYVRSVSMTTSMGPGIKVSTSELN